MKERPILFSGEMVRAILDGRKTQTRRPVTVPWRGSKRVAPYEPCYIENDSELMARDRYGDWHRMVDYMHPYGIPGDRLWVRETWRQYDRRNECECYDFCYCPPTGTVIYRSDRDDDEVKWRPSIHMPRWASRITLEVTDVRVEHVQEISAERVIGRSANPWVWVVEFVASEDWR